MSSDEFVVPHLDPADRILFWKEDNYVMAPAMGYVIEATQMGANVALLGGSKVIAFNDCLYRGDPKIKQKPWLLEDADRGIFELAPSEIALREATRELAAQRIMLDALAARVGLNQTTAPSRNKGRPPKTEATPGEVVSEEQPQEAA